MDLLAPKGIWSFDCLKKKLLVIEKEEIKHQI